jgi:hypothetical protein
MTTDTSSMDSFREYLPATLGPSTIVAGIERRLKGPFDRTYEIWLPEK